MIPKLKRKQSGEEQQQQHQLPQLKRMKSDPTTQSSSSSSSSSSSQRGAKKVGGKKKSLLREKNQQQTLAIQAQRAQIARLEDQCQQLQKRDQDRHRVLAQVDRHWSQLNADLGIVADQLTPDSSPASQSAPAPEPNTLKCLNSTSWSRSASPILDDDDDEDENMDDVSSTSSSSSGSRQSWHDKQLEAETQQSCAVSKGLLAKVVSLLETHRAHTKHVYQLLQQDVGSRDAALAARNVELETQLAAATTRFDSLQSHIKLESSKAQDYKEDLVSTQARLAQIEQDLHRSQMDLKHKQRKLGKLLLTSQQARTLGPPTMQPAVSVPPLAAQAATSSSPSSSSSSSSVTTTVAAKTCTWAAQQQQPTSHTQHTANGVVGTASQPPLQQPQLQSQAQPMSADERQELLDNAKDADELAQSRLAEIDRWRKELGKQEAHHVALEAKMQAASHRHQHTITEVRALKHEKQELLTRQSKLVADLTNQRVDYEQKMHNVSKSSQEAIDRAKDLVRQNLEAHHRTKSQLERAKYDMEIARDQLKSASKGTGAGGNGVVHDSQANMCKLNQSLVKANKKFVVQVKKLKEFNEKSATSSLVEMARSLLHDKAFGPQQKQALEQELLEAKHQIVGLEAQVEALKGRVGEAEWMAERSQALQRHKELEDELAATKKESTLQASLLSDLRSTPEGELACELSMQKELVEGVCGELDTVSSQYTDMQELNTKLTAHVAQLEDDKTKLVQSRFARSHERSSQQEQVGLMKRKLELQTDQLRKYDHTIKTVRAQIDNKYQEYEALVASSQSTVEMLERCREETRLKHQEMTAQQAHISQLNTALDRTNNENTDLRRKHHDLEHQHNRLQERCGKLSRKLLRAQERGSAQADKSTSKIESRWQKKCDNLEHENDIFKHKLYCPVFQSRQKNCALKSCGHTFSKQCIDQLIANRSRKCPSCGLPFARSDFVPIFLGS